MRTAWPRWFYQGSRAYKSPKYKIRRGTRSIVCGKLWFGSLKSNKRRWRRSLHKRHIIPQQNQQARKQVHFSSQVAAVGETLWYLWESSKYVARCQEIKHQQTEVFHRRGCKSNTRKHYYVTRLRTRIERNKVKKLLLRLSWAIFEQYRQDQAQLEGKPWYRSRTSCR